MFPLKNHMRGADDDQPTPPIPPYLNEEYRDAKGSFLNIFLGSTLVARTKIELVFNPNGAGLLNVT